MTMNFALVNMFKTGGKSVLVSSAPKSLKYIKPNTLRYIAEDVAKIKKYCLKDSPVYNLIKEKVLVHVPKSQKESVLKNYIEFVQTKADADVLNTLFTATNSELKGLSDYQIAKNFNTIFKNVRDLRTNAPQDYNLMIQGGFFDLVKSGKIAMQNFRTNMKHARLLVL